MRIILVIFCLLFSPAKASQQSWPKLIGKGPHCEEAFAIAKHAFNSKSFSLYGFPSLPEDFGSVLLLKPEDFDPYGDNKHLADQEVFEKVYKESADLAPDTGIYWQRRAVKGLRFVISEQRAGWRGALYALFEVKDNVTQKQFLDAYHDQVPTLSNRHWGPPIMLQEKNTGEIWAIDTGASYNFLDNWDIYWVAESGEAKRCTIQFHKAAEDGVKLLPKAVQKLAQLIDGTLGHDNDGGSMHPIMSLRNDVQHMWANVALRPWALSDEPYNTRAKVDLELRKWSRITPSFCKLYNNIQRQYPKAQQALAQHYQVKWNKSHKDAEVMAKRALDIAFRSYFIFHIVKIQDDIDNKYPKLTL